MAREKSPALKILWVWTLGTAAVLVTFVVKSRIRDMEKFVNAQQEQGTQRHPSAHENVVLDAERGPDDGSIQDRA